MSLKFYHIILILSVVIGGLIYVLHLFGLVTAANEVYARFVAMGVFIASAGILGIGKIKNHHFSKNDFYKNNTLIIISLILLLSSLFIYEKISYYLIGFFAFAVLLRFIYTKKFYFPPKFFYFIILYGLLMLFGTIGTRHGFHFPDKILSFFVLPLAFCCFRLSKKSLLFVCEIFVKMGIIFLAISILYWWFNFLHLHADFTNWIFGKSNYSAHMFGWLKQAKIMLSYQSNDITVLQNFPYFNAYFFVTTWSHHLHPTANALVILGGLIACFFLFFKKNVSVSKWDMMLYVAFGLFVILLQQSRIGLVGFAVTVSIAFFYYFKIKTKYFKIFLVIYILTATASLVVFNHKVENFINDDIRSTYRRIGISYIKEHFWWGCGFEQQQFVLNQQAEKIKDTLPDAVYSRINLPIQHVHNQFLGDMVQYGIWGLIALLAFLVSMAYYAIKNKSYLLQSFLCFIFCFMLIEEGEFIVMLILIMFFTAISENKNKLNKIYKN
ncbi:MAG: O-antigen ligase family protein [Paludibacter sp.]|nr:O-antigen ligase family protein [Paludibacter sp.]